MTVGTSATLVFGHTYLLRARLSTQTDAAIGLQCLGATDRNRVLVAWTILYVKHDQYVSPRLLPWWNYAAWRTLVSTIASKHSTVLQKEIGPT
jgi:hypothetical protein